MHKDPNNQKIICGDKNIHASCKEKICIFKIYFSNTRPKVKKHDMPLQYQAHKNVFEKKNVDMMHEHRPYNCAIDLEE